LVHSRGSLGLSHDVGIYKADGEERAFLTEE
jgi:hypothetical protein